MAESLMSVNDPIFKVDQRAVRERYGLLAQKLKRKLAYEQKASGIETEMSEVEMLVEELIEKENISEESCLKESNEKAKERVAAEDMRTKAMETFAQTKRRKSDEEPGPRSKRARTSGKETMAYLKEKNEVMINFEKEKLECKKKQHELEVRKQEELMQLMIQQQQQQQQQNQQFQRTMNDNDV